MGCSGSRTATLTTQTATLQQNYALTNDDVHASYKLFTKILQKSNKAKIKLHAVIQPATTLKLVDVRLAFNFGCSILTEHWFECAKLIDVDAVTFPEFLHLCTLIALCDRKQLITFLFYSFPLNKETNLISLQTFFKVLLLLQESFAEIPLPIDVLHDQLKQIVLSSPATIISTPIIPPTGVADSPGTTSAQQTTTTIVTTIISDEPPTDDTIMVSFDHFQQLLNQHTSLYSLCSSFQDNIAQTSRTKVEWLNTRQHLLKTSPNVLANLTDSMKYKNYKLIELVDKTNHSNHSRKASQAPSVRRRKASKYLESLRDTIATELNATKILTQIDNSNNIALNSTTSNAVLSPKKSIHGNARTSNEPSLLHTRAISSKIATYNGEVSPSLTQPINMDQSARRGHNNETARGPSRLVNKASTVSRRQMSVYALPSVKSMNHSPRAGSPTKTRSKRRSMRIGTALSSLNAADEKTPKTTANNTAEVSPLKKALTVSAANNSPHKISTTQTTSMPSDHRHRSSLLTINDSPTLALAAIALPVAPTKITPNCSSQHASMGDALIKLTAFKPSANQMMMQQYIQLMPMAIPPPAMVMRMQMSLGMAAMPMSLPSAYSANSHY